MVLSFGTPLFYFSHYYMETLHCSFKMNKYNFEIKNVLKIFMNHYIFSPKNDIETAGQFIIII